MCMRAGGSLLRNLNTGICCKLVDNFSIIRTMSSGLATAVAEEVNIATNISAIKHRIGEAASGSGRDGAAIDLVAVSKFKTAGKKETVY